MNILSEKIYDKKIRPIRVIQFGEGNFLRAFVDWIIQNLNKECEFNGNVIVVQPLKLGRVEELKKQDGLYNLMLQGIINQRECKSIEVIDVLSEFNNPYLEYNSFLEIAKDPNIDFIISNTTEAGIYYEERDNNLNNTPISFPGKLLALLKTRFDNCGGMNSNGFEILPCELIKYNGDTLKEILFKLCELNHFSDDFRLWIETKNHFYNTLVDRIVPGFPMNDSNDIFNDLGYVDNNLVKAEIFYLWVIEDKYGLKQRLKIKDSQFNIEFVDDILPYEERKVKILNGPHTCMALIGILSGIRTVKEAIENPKIKNFIDSYVSNEVIPSINLSEEESQSFYYSVVERFKNPYIVHNLESISLNSLSKFNTRILQTTFNCLDNNAFPYLSLFALACLIVFYKGSYNNNKINLKDNEDYIHLANMIWNNYDGSDFGAYEVVHQFFMQISPLSDERLRYERVERYISKMVQSIITKGINASIDEALSMEKS